MKYTIIEPDLEWQDYKGMLVVLTGRGQSADDLMWEYKNQCELDDTLQVYIEPNLEWYPRPNGPNDKMDSVIGLSSTVREVSELIEELRNRHLIEDVCIAGFSAGAVVALEIAVRGQNFDGVVSHSGAILEPDKVRPPQNDMGIFLIHHDLDTVFTTKERHEPTKAALAAYNLLVLEYEEGKHELTRTEIVAAAMYMAPLLGYAADWQHSSLQTA